jgi:membrane fusion protein (multidrug efflux system)
MTQSLSPVEADLPLPSNVQELRPVTDRVPAIEPKPLPLPVARRGRFKQLMMAGVAAAFLVGAGWYGWDYWTVGRYLVSTDDAYVKADNTTVAPKVSGYLSEVLVNDNEPVKAGTVLARIDDRDYKVALDQAKAAGGARGRHCGRQGNA